jgi:heme exporter protein D
MQHEFAYEITDELMLAATRRFLIANLGWPVVVLFALYFALLVPFCMMTRWHFLCGLLSGAILILLLIVVMMWLMRKRAALRAARRYESRAARFSAGEEGLVLQNSLATSNLKWKLIQTLVRGPDVWLLYMNRQHYFALPADRLAGEIGAFVAARVAAAGGRVR